MSYNAVLTRGVGSTPTGATGTHPLIPEDVSRTILKSTTEDSAALSMFKHRTMSTAQQRMPILAQKPTAYWVQGDTGRKQTTSVTWANKYLDAEELAVIVPVPEKLLDDVDYDIWGEIKPEIIEAMAVALDAAIFFGYNKPASWPLSIVDGAILAGNTVTQTAQSATHDVADDINSAMAAVELDGFDVTGFFIRNNMKAELRNLRDGNHGLIFQPNTGVSNAVYKGTIFGEKAVSSKIGIFEEEDAGNYSVSVPANAYPANHTGANAVKMITGDFAQGIVGVRQDLTWKMLDQAVITNAAGAIIFNLPQDDMVAMRVVARYGWQISNPMTRMNMNSASRYPFAVMRDAA